MSGGPPGRPCPSHARPSPRRGVRGFSLLEMLLVVVLIASISTVIAIGMRGGMGGLQLRSASKEIAAQLRYTRTQAITSGAPQRFVIDPQAHTWQAPNGRSGEIPPDLRVIFIGARQLQPSPGEGAIMFFADGASTGGRVQVSLKSAAWNIDVAWLTGQVKLRRAEVTR